MANDGKSGGSAQGSSTGPRALYDARCAVGSIRADPAQARAVDRLEKLYRQLRDRAPGARGWLGRLIASPTTAPRGLYLWGPVGRGKSMLMDLFF
ncbi:MAG TPA: AFG1/ZapE family ATPase, partial [Stellaceae bacterium]|nr:AFG1/ZapE family ATPase [Stellaceae bacterium]